MALTVRVDNEPPLRDSRRLCQGPGLLAGVPMSKLGRVIVTHPVATSKRKIEIPIRLNVHTGVFSAELDGIPFQSERLGLLRRSLTKAAMVVDGDGDQSSPTDGSVFDNVIDIPDAGEK